MHPRIADGHTHAFNAGFVPIEGIVIARGYSAAVASFFSGLIDQLLERTWPPPMPTADDNFASQRVSFYETVESEIVTASHRPSRARSDTIDRIVDAIPDADMAVIAPRMEGLRPQRRSRHRITLTTAPSSPFFADRIRLIRLLRDIAMRSGDVETTPENCPQLPNKRSWGSLVEWALLLVVHEIRLNRRFSATWEGEHDFAFRVHHMMDMANHYAGPPPEYDFVDEQMTRMRAVARDAPILTLGFTAFDPFRCDCQAIIDKAVRSGFVGVKFYPPNGFRPIGNTAADIHHGPPPDVVDQRNIALFKMCVDQHVPIFTHCTCSGMESILHESGLLSDPAGWKTVLQQPGLEALRLCLGHAGGQDGWFAPLDASGDITWDKSYAKTVVELCLAYDNVYCDFGYFDQLLVHGKWSAYFAARLTKVIAESPGHRFAAKCCYGTDWHLMLQEGDAAQFPTRFINMLNRPDAPLLTRYQDQILYKNTLSYLALPEFLRRSSSALSSQEISRIQALVKSPLTLCEPGI